MTGAERMRKMRAIHREKGLCIHCTKPVEPGYTVCASHHRYFTERNHRPEYKAKEKARLRAKLLARVFGNESGVA